MYLPNLRINDPGTTYEQQFGVLRGCGINASGLSSIDAKSDAVGFQEFCTLRTTVNIDDELLSEAQRMTGVAEKTTLIREGLRALIERESARRLARLGGSDSTLRPVPRRQSDPA